MWVVCLVYHINFSGDKKKEKINWASLKKERVSERDRQNKANSKDVNFFYFFYLKELRET